MRTSDIHSRLFPTYLKPNSHDVGDGLYEETAPYGGVERVSGIIHREKLRGQRVVYIDSGDVFQGVVGDGVAGQPQFGEVCQRGEFGQDGFRRQRLQDLTPEATRYVVGFAGGAVEDEKAHTEGGHAIGRGECRPPPAPPPNHTLYSSSAASDVYKRQEQGT